MQKHSKKREKIKGEPSIVKPIIDTIHTDTHPVQHIVNVLRTNGSYIYSYRGNHEIHYFRQLL